MRRSSRGSLTAAPAIAGRRPTAASRGAGRPHLQQRQHRSRRYERGDDVGQLDVDVVGDRELHHRKRQPRGQRGRPALAKAPASVDHEHEHERDDHRQERGLPSNHLAECVNGQPGHLTKGDDRNRDCPERHRRGVGHQRDGRGLDRLHAEAHQHDPADRDRCAEAREGLEQRAEAERDHDDLDSEVIGHRGERPSQHCEVSCGVRHVEDPQRVDDDPHDRPEAEHRPFQSSVPGLPDRHRVDGQRDHDRDAERHQCSPVRFHPHHAEEHEQHNQRQDGKDRCESQRMGHGIQNLLVHGDLPHEPSRPTASSRRGYPRVARLMRGPGPCLRKAVRAVTLLRRSPARSAESPRRSPGRRERSSSRRPSTC